MADWFARLLSQIGEATRQRPNLPVTDAGVCNTVTLLLERYVERPDFVRIEAVHRPEDGYARLIWSVRRSGLLTDEALDAIKRNTARALLSYTIRGVLNGNISEPVEVDQLARLSLSEAGYRDVVDPRAAAEAMGGYRDAPTLASQLARLSRLGERGEQMGVHRVIEQLADIQRELQRLASARQY